MCQEGWGVIKLTRKKPSHFKEKGQGQKNPRRQMNLSGLGWKKPCGIWVTERWKMWGRFFFKGVEICCNKKVNSNGLRGSKTVL